MANYKLYYDSTCPVCKTFVQFIRRKVDANRISFLAGATGDENFKLESSIGEVYFGKEATEVLAREFPTILNYFWMLPAALKVPALNVVYKVGGAIRKAVKGCGCGKK